MTPIDDEDRVLISRGQYEALVPAHELKANREAIIENLERLNFVAEKLKSLEENHNITFRRVLRISNLDDFMTMH